MKIHTRIALVALLLASSASLQAQIAALEQRLADRHVGGPRAARHGLRTAPGLALPLDRHVVPFFTSP